MSMFHSINTTASALTSQRLRMDVISSNMANAETTRSQYVDGEWQPYSRKAVVLQSKENESLFLRPQRWFAGTAGGGGRTHARSSYWSGSSADRRAREQPGDVWKKHRSEKSPKGVRDCAVAQCRSTRYPARCDRYERSRTDGLRDAEPSDSIRNREARASMRPVGLHV